MTPFRLLSLTLFAFLAIYEAGNLTGFSWERLEYVPEKEIIDAAVRFEFGEDVYSNFEELQRDYSKFKPQVRYWGSWSWESENGLLDKLLGFRMYQVRLPEGVVLVTVDGKGHKRLHDDDCPGTGERGCPVTPPDNPEQGIVGTVQYEEPQRVAANDFVLQWEDEGKGDIYKSGHCFSVYVNSPKIRNLVIRTKGAGPTGILTGYGFYLVVVRSDAKFGIIYARMRISKSEFLKSRSCSPEAREAWPNLGGYGWIR